MSSPPQPSPEVTVVIADLVASREHPDRAELQARLTRDLARLDEELGPADLATPPTLTAGDEVQVVLRRPEVAVRVIQELTDRLHGADVAPAALERLRDRIKEGRDPRQRVAFGVGRGTLSTGPLPAAPARAKNPALLDGPAFHRARAALERVRSVRGWAAFEGFDERVDATLDALFALQHAVRSGWGTMQWIYGYEARRQRYRKDIAERFGVAPSVVSESLKAAHLEAVLAGEAAARALLAPPSELPEPPGEQP